MSFIEQYLLQLNTQKRRWRCAVAILTALSLIVALVTGWNLRMTGVTIANGATCGYEEHQHTAECVEKTLICGYDLQETIKETTGTTVETTETTEKTTETTAETTETTAETTETTAETTETTVETTETTAETTETTAETTETTAETTETTAETTETTAETTKTTAETTETTAETTETTAETTETTAETTETTVETTETTAETTETTLETTETTVETTETTAETTETTAETTETTAETTETTAETTETTEKTTETTEKTTETTEKTTETTAETTETTEKTTEPTTETTEPTTETTEPEADKPKEPAHVHTDACYKLVVRCGLEEHIHQISCYSDPEADVETPLEWQDMFSNYFYTENLRKDLVGIAKTQVGYEESRLNFEVKSDGIRRGYTRYGAWHGAPYNDWSAMFVSFCLNYAGADAAEFPQSSGAATMAKLWEKQERYAPAGQYIPQSGDIVFFNNNTVGIVTEVHTAAFGVIRGDVQDAVADDILSLSDPTIAGWGITKTSALQEQAPPETPAPLPDALLDISNGPAFFIIEGGQPPSKAQRFSLRAPRAITELIPYLNANGGNYFFTLLDNNNVELPKDENGNYIAVANEGYKLTLTFNSPKGFAPGTYQYQIPNGLMVDGGNGSFLLKDGTNVGTWEVTDTGLITLVFNEHINSRTDITISSTLGIHFPEQDDPIDFDGFITVKVEPPIQQKFPTELSKWGSPNADAGKLNWFVLIKGHADSEIPGSILTDQTTLPDWGKPHSYTESDMAAGINFGVTAADGSWHTWTVTTDDPHLIWDESGWSYKIPQTVQCLYCGQLELGNDGWEYMVTYTSTPTALNTPGAFAYENKVTVDGQTAWGWNEFTHGKIDAEIIKDGNFVSDATGGGFRWEFQAIIPGRAEGERAQYSWFIMDEMKLFDANGTTLRRVHNDVNLSTVTALYDGAVIPIPRIQDATDQDLFAWDVAWTSDGVAATRTINLLCRCQCTPTTCHWGGCEEYWFNRGDGTYITNGFCQCWTETQNMTFNFVYKTEDVSLLEDYGALNYQLNNLAQLYYMTDGSTSIQVDYDDATVTIPSLFEKKLTQDFNGHTAHYTITINESKAVLTNGSPLTIRDEMTDTLAYISGSLIITAENANGHRTVLQQGTDYTVTYDGTGTQKDQNGKKVHVLEIEIIHPQPVMYILDYDTTLIMPEQLTGGVKYSNSATVTLWGQEIKDTATEKVYADINIAAKSFAVELFKTCALTNKPLPGATFGLYNAQGGLITTGVTDANGKLVFQTNVVKGIILREHELYYMQEIQPPPTYQLDDTPYWFCFCGSTGISCEDCEKTIQDVEAMRIPFEQIGLIHVVNQPVSCELPATGGIGTHLYILSGLALVLAPFVYGFRLRRRHERRSKR